jgi:hypothetical protein
MVSILVTSPWSFEITLVTAETLAEELFNNSIASVIALGIGGRL